MPRALIGPSPMMSIIADVTLQGRLKTSSYTCKTFLCFITEICAALHCHRLRQETGPPEGGSCPPPPTQSWGPPGTGGGKGIGGTERATGTRGRTGPYRFLGAPRGPLGFLREPWGLPETPGGLQGAPGGPGGTPGPGPAWASRRAGGPERRGARSSLTPPGPGAISLTTLEGPQGS